MGTPKSDGSVRFLYGTALGRGLLQLIRGLHADRLVVRYLCSRWSRPYIRRFAQKNDIPLTEEELAAFRSYREFFLRERAPVPMDTVPGHLISPCDGFLSAFPIHKDSSFALKGSHYRLQDLLTDEALASRYAGGLCLIFRLCASDYHHYCYIDDGRQGPNHFIEGQLHSVQPIACERYPVFTLNRRSWCLLDTEHFGPVVQTEIGALIVGGIVNLREGGSFRRGEEKGRFDLAGSTIVLLLEPGRAALLPELQGRLQTEPEVPVHQGMWIGVGLQGAAEA